ncbi:Anaerobic glycerol-3-phosphate dehydrogenase subunit C [compost metagenome]
MAKRKVRTKEQALQISMLPSKPLAVADLEADLCRELKGEVRFDSGSRALYASDASSFREVPIGVVIPKTREDVLSTIALCRQHGAPILSRGGGTSLAGQCCNFAVVMDFSKYLNHLLELDPAQKCARVEPGIILDSLRNAAETHHLTFGPDPATHSRCTLGGMIGNNSCGVHAQAAGKTSDNILALEIATYDGHPMTVRNHYDDAEVAAIIEEGGRTGEIFARLRALRDRFADAIRREFPRIPRNISGYPLFYLLPEHGFNVAGALTGTESTCVTVLEATTRLIESPPVKSLVVLGFPDVYTACDHVPDVLAFQPFALEGMDDELISYMKKKHLHTEHLDLLPEGRGWLIAQFGGQTREEADRPAKALMQTLFRLDHPPDMRLYDLAEKEAQLWEIRESAVGATAMVPGMRDTWPGWEDSAVAPERLGDYLRDLRALMNRYGLQGAYYGHFGQGCLHCRIDFDMASVEGIRQYRRFMGDAADLVVRYGGSFSGEHGDGQVRAELLPRMFSPEMMAAFREFKAIWDPDGKMNPGKMVDPYPLDAYLRQGPQYDPPNPLTHFKFPEENGSFAHAAARCVGVGKCRKIEGGTMCPSFMVTREEKDSTRGRGHALYEMLQGDVLTGGWRDEHVKEALNLCLSCKGCKAECPVNVDMATYKAEFLSHYYAGRLRPRVAYTLGLVTFWARLASRMPALANGLAHAPIVGVWVKRLAGLAPEREIPRFAPETFRAWFRRRPPSPTDRPRIILWADTFNNHFTPEVAKAGVEVLEAAGFQVTLPPESLCCGRPLYDYGFLDQAERQLRQILDALRAEIRDGTPVVGLEPSCVAVFRDELTNLFPHDEDARRLKLQTFMLSEFLDQKAPDFALPAVGGRALVHGHCHHKSILNFPAERRVLDRLGLDYQVLDSGCCGLAGSFGFEPDKYDVSVKAGERVLFPAVRAAETSTRLLTDGFSCREQIAHGTRRRTQHLAELIQEGLRAEGRLPSQEPAMKPRAASRAPLLVGAGLLAVVGFLAWRASQRQGG